MSLRRSITARAAKTYRGARRNAARGQVWSEHHYYAGHTGTLIRREALCRFDARLRRKAYRQVMRQLAAAKARMTA
jgi:hypothetical protein